MNLQHQRRRPSVGLTSLIDVIFILIVFFMLVSTFSQYRTLDLISRGSTVSDQQTIRLRLLADGRSLMGLNAGDHSTDHLIQQAVVKRLPVSIFLPGEVTLQQGVDLLERLKQQGVVSVSLVPSGGQTDATQ
ncbi:MAG: biopolymer transporter ExbD [Amphritea sp.]|nr:biopolymer transporter ExbD [Amphritea sp.]